MRPFLSLIALTLLLGGCASNVGQQLRPSDNRLNMAAGGSVEVKPGDTIYSIARRHNVPMSAVIAENQLKPPYVLQPGQSLRVPGASREDNVGLVNDPYAATAAVSGRTVDATSLDAVPVSSGSLDPLPVAAAPLADGSGGTHEMVLTPTGPVTTPPPLPEPVVDNSIAAPTKLTPDEPAPAKAAPVAAPKVAKGVFSWPLDGRASNASADGVDIAAPKGTAVTAAAGGTVASVQANSVTIQHAGGATTSYGNLERVLVDKDTVVAKGDAIGTVGSSAGGSGKAAQLRFSLTQNGQPVDPTAALPAK